MFAIAYVREIRDRHVLKVNPLFERTARERDCWSEQLMADIAGTGTLPDDSRVPQDVRRDFVTAFEVSPTAHVRMQAAIQRHVDAGVSKTVNLPPSSSVDDVKHTYMSAWCAGVKGITVYRYNSRPNQVLTLPQEAPGRPSIQVETEYTGGCAGHICEY